MGSEQAAPAGGAGRYRGFSDLSRFPLGEGLELVYLPLTRAAQVLSTWHVRLLLACRACAALDDHARRLCRELNLGPDRGAAVRQELAGLVQAGLLVSQDDLRRLCQRRFDGPGEAPRIAAVGIPTRNRTRSLERCLVSYLESSRNHSRAVDFVVVDDSDLEARRANRHLLQTLQARYGTPLFYAGPEEKARYAESLARQAGLPVDVVAFGLLNPDGYPVATGGSRNALLLHSAGECLLQVDDDTVCWMLPVPDSSGGLTLTSRFDPTEFWFFTDDEPPPSAAFADADLLALHEELLGKRVGECLSALPAGAAVDFDQANASFFRKLDGRGGRVLVTAAGVAGASGMGSPAYLLTLDGPSRARLLRDEQTYRQALTGGAVLRAVPRPTLSEGALCMGVNLGLDNRELLPPFLPVQRNQDGVFGALLRACCRAGTFGFLPRGLLHEPPSPRNFSPEDLLHSAGRVHAGQILQALVRSLVARPDETNCQQSLRALGGAFREWGSLTAADFAEVVRVPLWGHLSKQAVLWESQLRHFAGRPEFWANHVRSLLARLRAASPGTAPERAQDLVEAFGPDEAPARLQGLVGKFGRLLQVWPDLTEAAKDLRMRGVRLTAGV